MSTTYIRDRHVIRKLNDDGTFDEEAEKHHNSINLAKKASTALQSSGSTVRKAQ